jgi:hypothetical protein
MSPKTLRYAIAEAKRFLIAAQKAHASANEDGYFDSNAATAAAKRASMDLSKALSAMRKPT